MKRNIYALLVGIDEYPEGINSLEGCVNDINAIETYLRTQLNPEQYQLHLRKLLNQEATRAAVIDGFQDHLCQASNQDIAFFYYSGHGSKELAPLELLSIEPNRQLETIVCYDSRIKGGFDLADRELAYLLSQAREKPQFVLILDCCHSGSGFRDTLPEKGVRRTMAQTHVRSINDFIFPIEAIEMANSSTDATARNRSGWRFPAADYILLAACLDSELAKEYNKRGVFSYFLLNTLEKATSSLTYREVFDRAKALVCAQVKDQSPQLEATQPKFWDLPFLGFEGEEAIVRQHSVMLSLENQNIYSYWCMNWGAIHGLTANSVKPIRLNVYLPGNWETPIGEVEVTEVFPEKSIVRLLQPLVLNGVIQHLPIPPMNVFLDGNRVALQVVEQRLADTTLVKTLTTADGADYRLLANNNQYSITLPYDDRPLVKQIQSDSEKQAELVVKQLEHIARWLTILKQENPISSLPSNAVKMQIYHKNEEILDPEFRLEYQWVRDEWKQPTIQIKLTNTTSRKLYCVLLNLTELYGIFSPFFNHTGIWLQSGETKDVTLIRNGNLTTEIPFLLPEELWKQGVTEYLDILKLFISTVEFDLKSMLQIDLDAPDFVNSARAIRREPETTLRGDWITNQMAVTIVRPQNDTVLAEGKTASLGAGVTIQAPTGLQATARLTSSSQIARKLGTQMLPVLQEQTQPFQFTASRGIDSGLNALELSIKAVETLSAVTPETPIKLTVEQSLQADESILPIAFHSKLVLPLGQGISKGQRTEIVINRLPDPETTQRLGGLLRILFQKLTRKNLNDGNLNDAK